MDFDRCYFRGMRADQLLYRARDIGLTPELSVAIAERLAEYIHMPQLIGAFQPTHDTGVKA